MTKGVMKELVPFVGKTSKLESGYHNFVTYS